MTETADIKSLRRWWLLAALPALAHLARFGWSVVNEGYVIFGRLDLVVLLLVILYLLAIPFVIRTRTAELAWLTVVVSTVLAVAAANALAYRWMPQPLVENYPWPPMSRVRDVSPSIVGVKGPAKFTINRLGVRGPNWAPKPDEISILMVGGSTTECLYVSDEKSWPWKSAELLTEKLQQPVYVGNAGRSGLAARHHAHLIRNYAAIDLFDWVVVMCGINDLGMLLHEDRDRRLQKVADESLFYVRRPHEPYYRQLTLWRLMEVVLDVGTPVASGSIVQDAAGGWIDRLREQRREKLRQRRLDEPPAGLETALRNYADDLRDVVAAARERGRRLVFVTQPTLWSSQLSSDAEKLLWERTNDGAYGPGVLNEMMAAFNQVMLDVARETETPYIDLASQIPKDATVFYDDCHFNDGGCAQVSDRLSSELARIIRPEPATP